MIKTFQVFVTTPSKNAAQKICRELLRERLAACAQIIGPMSSSYWWQSKITSAKEWLCLLKTDETHYQKLERKIKRLHPYEIPEIIALPIITGSTDYLCWLKKELKKRRNGED